MTDLIKIREISSKYDISARTLRYYEDMGLITSTRSDDYAYRLYDEAAILRLEQILILRKLNISIKDIKRIFGASGSEIVLDVLGKKIDAIDEEVSLLHELKEIVLDFIRHIEQADFAKESDVKLLYEKARDIEAQLINVDYNGNPARSGEGQAAPSISRLLDVTERLDTKVPDVIIARIPAFRAVTMGHVSWDEIFDAEYEAWREAHMHFFTPILFDGYDFMYGKDDMVAWIWRIKDTVTEKDVAPYQITQFQGGLYAVAVSVDGDGESHDKVRSKMAKWLEGTNFIIDTGRYLMGHMIYVDDEIKQGLGYEQMALYAPVKLKDSTN